MGERNKRTKLKKSMGPGSIWAVAVGSITVSYTHLTLPTIA